MNQNLGERITAEFGGLAPAQRRVAQFFGQQAARLGFFSAVDIARQLETSDATVVRTAQALGYRGLGDLKRALADTTAAEHDPTPSGRLHATLDHGEGPGAVLEHALDVAQATLAVAREQLQPTFPLAVATLARADRIVLSGTGPSAAVARYAATLLNRAGRVTATITATGVSMADEALALRGGDVLVLLAYTRLHRHAAVLLRHARRRGVPVVLLTDTLTELGEADVVLTCPRGLPGHSSSHGLTLVVLEALTTALAADDRRTATRTLRELNQLRTELLGTRADVDRG